MTSSLGTCSNTSRATLISILPTIQANTFLQCWLLSFILFIKVGLFSLFKKENCQLFYLMRKENYVFRIFQSEMIIVVSMMWTIQSTDQNRFSLKASSALTGPPPRSLLFQHKMEKPSYFLVCKRERFKRYNVVILLILLNSDAPIIFESLLMPSRIHFFTYYLVILKDDMDVTLYPCPSVPMYMFDRSLL